MVPNHLPHKLPIHRRSLPTPLRVGRTKKGSKTFSTVFSGCSPWEVRFSLFHRLVGTNATLAHLGDDFGSNFDFIQTARAQLNIPNEQPLGLIWLPTQHARREKEVLSTFATTGLAGWLAG